MGACGGLRVMLWKNYLLKRRRPCMTTMEILLPAAVAVLMVVIRLAAPVDDDIPATMHFGVTYDNNGGVINLRTDLTWALYEQWKYPWNNRTGAPLIMKVGMAPDDANTHHLAEHLFNVSMRDELVNNHHQANPSYLDHFMFFEDNEGIEAYTTHRDYGKDKDGTYRWPIRFAVVLKDWLPLTAPPEQARMAKWEYTMRFNSTVICPPSHLDRQDRMLSCFVDTVDTTADFVDQLGRHRQAMVKPYAMYHKGAFWIVQNHIDRYIMSRRAGVESGLTDDGQPPYAIVETSEFPERARKEDAFVQITESVMGLFFLMVFLTPFSILVKNLVEEKELKLKEAMRMMGLSDGAFWGSWIVSYIVQFAITALLVTVVGVGTVYEHSNIGIVFIFFFLFMLSTFGFATMISAFFDRAKTASTFSSMLMFGIFFPTYVINDPDDTLNMKTLACLSPPVALALGVTKIAQLESIGAGAQWDNVDLVLENFSLGTAMGMLLLDVVLYSLLGMYLTYVIPGKYGTPKPFYFPLLPSFWRECFGCKKTIGDGSYIPDFDKTLVAGDRIEEVPVELRDKVGMQLRNLRKEYDGEAGKIVAVAGTNLDLFEGQILALLGHNGAGKSTTISILTGLYPPTSGDALIYGMSVTRDMESIRNILGVCPQEDVLYPTLTVYEHLILYANLRGKGGDRKTLDAEIDMLLRELALTEKKHTPSAALSGGQKRKLCTGNAMIGDAKVIFLDEPTSGMDPFARRSFWSFLQKKKEGRVIVLTTHMMDEADCLGDRIAIMAKGTVQCCGSSLFLKRHYGVGYLMTCTMSNPALLHSLLELVRSNVPGVDEPKVAAIEVQFRLPFSASSSFPSLFTALDLDIADGGRKFGVSTYGVGVTTLEEVFLKVDEDAHDGNRFGQADEKKRNAGTAAGAEAKAEDGVINIASPKDSEPFMDWAVGDLADENASFFLRHFDALLRKRFHNYKRDRRAVVFQVFLPLVVVSIGLALTMAFSLYTFPTVLMSTEQYNTPLPMPFNANPSFAHPAQTCRPIADPWQDCSPFGNASSCGATASCCYQENSWPGCGTCSFCEVHEGAHVGVNTRTLAPLAPFMDPPGTAVPYVNDTVNMKQYLLASVGGYPSPDAIRAIERKNLDRNDCTWLNRFSSGPAVNRQRVCFPPAIPFENRNYHKESTFGAFVAPAMRKDFWWSLGNPSHTVQGVTLMINTTATHAVPIFTNVFHNSLLKFLVNNTDAGIITHSQPLSPTHQEELAVSQALSFAAVMIFSIAYSFIPASFVMFVIRERETNSKHQQIISGVSIWAYWLSSFVWDFSAYLITAAISMGIIAAFDIEELLGEAGGAVFLLLFIYGLAVTAFAYAFSFFFKSPSNGQNAMIFFNFLFGVIAAIVMFVLDRIPSTEPYADPIKYILRLIPNYCLSDALINILMRSVPVLWGGPKGPWDFVITGVDYLFLIIGFVAWLAATLVFEKLVSTPRLLRSCEPHHLQPVDTQFKLKGEDSDLIAERERLIATRSDNEEKRAEGGWIRCEGLMKAYRSPPKVAVKDFWLNVPPGECFGFLGLNGAGKSSVLSMLGVDKVPTRGTAYLKGIDIVQYPERVRRLIGYCPQRDALFELLTAREHLELYARIKGVREERVKDYVDKVLKQLSLTPWADEVSQAYSGGNKRKLSVGIALIGSPPICFLDEPSSGMDPASRRSMWDLISKTMAGRTVILTTHSMEECEALCPRIGIMVSGRLRCLGSAHHLKQKYGSGYQLDATVGLSKGDEKTSLENPDETRAIVATFKAFVQQQWPSAQLLEEHTNRLKFRLPRDQMPLGAIFSLIEHNRAYLRIDEYSVSETTLEQIFLTFAQQREEELDAVPGLVGAAGFDGSSVTPSTDLVLPAHLPPVPQGPASGSLVTIPVREAEAHDIELSDYTSSAPALAPLQQHEPLQGGGDDGLIG